MTPEEKDTLVQFMGQVYGESKKNDQMLVGQSTNLQPKSNQVRQQFEQVLKTPVQNKNTPYPQQPPSMPTVPTVITPEQAQQELAQSMSEQVVVPEPTQTTGEPAPELAPVDPNQMEFDLSEPSKLDKLIELIEQQNKILLEIRDSSIKSTYGTKRAKNKKPQ